MLCFICRKAAQSNAATVTQNGVTWQNTYNADGLRTKRTGGGNTYEYVYYGGSLQYMEYNGQAVYFTHAPDGTPMGMLTEGNAYFYITNLQGDVVGILNSSGQVVVQYTYDAWGNLLSTTGTMADTLGVLNPLRYRGYVYDTETGLYYLQSRYYDPEIGRFINADAFTSTGQGFTGNNMFAYCGNNPVTYEDDSGGMRKPCTVVIDDGSIGSASTLAIGVAKSVAFSIGYSSVAGEGSISVNLDQYNDTINYLNLIMYVSLDVICSEIAVGANKKHVDVYGSAFLLSNDCIAKEIYEHIIAYQWSIGQRFIPNIIAVGFYFRANYSACNVYNATRLTDIRETEVTGNLRWDSQGFWFQYKDGIRDCYIGTPRDPWKDER